MNHVIYLVGGIGRRMNADIPKQFLEVQGKPVFIYTLERIQYSGSVDGIVIVTHSEWKNVIEETVARYGISKIEAIICGGATRQESIYNGARYLCDSAALDDVVCLVDGNRALMPTSLVESSINCVDRHTSTMTVLPSFDSLFLVKEGEISASVDRSTIFRGQTPEAAYLEDMMTVLEKGRADCIKDAPLATLMLRYGYKVLPIQGEERNFKITTRQDLELFEMYVQNDVTKAQEYANI